MPASTAKKKTVPRQSPSAQGAAAPPLQPTSVEEWGGAEEGFLITLPSGKVCRIKRTLDMTVQLSAGLIPNPLATIIRQSMHSGEGNFMKEAAKDDKALEQMMAMVDRNVVNSVVEPKISMPDPRGDNEGDEAYVKRLNEWKPTPGTLSIWMVDVQDRLYIMTVAQGRAADLESFLLEQKSGLDAVPASREVRRAAQRSPRKKSQ